MKMTFDEILSDAKKNGKASLEVASFMCTKLHGIDLPPRALGYFHVLSNTFGHSNEVKLTAFSHYLQIEENLREPNGLYKIKSSDRSKYKKNEAFIQHAVDEQNRINELYRIDDKKSRGYEIDKEIRQINESKDGMRSHRFIRSLAEMSRDCR
jgi:hypothetical protein